MSKQTHFFATKSDLQGGLLAFEALWPVAYTRCGLFESRSEITSFSSLIAWNGLGVHPTGDTVTGDRFLVSLVSCEVQVRVVPQKGGGARFAVDQLQNVNSIVLVPGGLFDEANMIAGSVGTASESPASVKLLRDFVHRLTRGFARVAEYRVGPEAMNLLRGNVRFVTMGLRSPREYDLRLS